MNRLEPRFRPEEILRVLGEHEVRYIVVGGFAAIIHGSPIITADIDITPEDSRKNLEHLSAALTDMNARIRTEAVPEGLPFSHDAESLMQIQIVNLITDYGSLDLTFVPAGTQGYEDLRRDAREKSVGGVRALIASLADVVRSKEAANRTKDRGALPVLRKMIEATPPNDPP